MRDYKPLIVQIRIIVEFTFENYADADEKSIRNISVDYGLLDGENDEEKSGEVSFVDSLEDNDDDKLTV